MPKHDTNSTKTHAKETSEKGRPRMSLGFRAHLLNIVFPIIVASVILWMGLAISEEIADDSALRISRQYSIEAAANFQVYMNSHMVLMNQMSYSTAIARWLANEFDETAKIAAFEAMMGHAATWPYAYFMFTVAETLSGYNFNVDLTFNEFVSWGQLSGGEASQWFFDTRDAELPFILNIQRSRPDEGGNWDLYIWSNHRIYYQDQFVGVFTIGSPFADVAEATFGGFCEDERRGYIIDEFGNVRIDSAGELETTAEGLPMFPPVPEAQYNPVLMDSLHNHRLYLEGGMFPLGTPTLDAIRLGAGEFSYGSISPIVGTNWSIVVLSSHGYVFDVRYMQLIVVAIALLGLSAVGGNLLVRSMMREINNLRNKERDAEFDFMIEKTPFICVVFDRKGNVLNVNQHALDFFGFTSKEEYAKDRDGRAPEFQPDGSRSNTIIANNMDKAFITGETVHVPNWTSRTKSGELLPLEVFKVPTTVAGKKYAVVYGRDLREQLKIKEMEEAQRRSEAELEKVQADKNLQEERQRKELAEASNRAKSNFLARMSHEVRTPITAVMGISEIEIHNPSLPLQTAESFGKIYKSANALLGIVNDILDLSKIESGKFELIDEGYEVASMIVDASHIHLVHVGRKDIGFSVHVDENLPARLEGDSIRIIQIISNLLSNAFKYTMEGNVKLSFSCTRDGETTEGVTLVLSIQDTGLGMTPEQVSDLSNEYTRYHEREYRFIEGTGLGMPIVFNLIKMMGAEVEINSEVNKGTTVVVKIPQKAASDNVLGSDLAQRLEQLEENTLSVGKRFLFEPESMPYGRVLVVDDVEENLYVARGLLAFYDLEIITCESGYEAVNKIRNGEVYDIVFMDYMMPGISGTDAMWQMRELGYDAPIVALTANAMIGKAEEFMQSGFDGYMSKPIQTKNLNAILIKYVKNKQPPQVIEAALKANADKPAKKRDIHGFQKSPELLKKLREDFARGHKYTFQNLVKSMDEGDIGTAHRMAHTVKGAAGLIYEDKLLEAAFDVEQKLKMRRQPTKQDLSNLEHELQRVIDDIGEAKAEAAAETEMLSKTEATALLAEVLPLLADRSVESVKMLSELKKIPDSADLCSQIEDFDFASAHETVLRMMREFE